MIRLILLLFTLEDVLLHSSQALPMDREAKEVTGILYTQETVNVARIQQHMVTWLREVERSTDSLDRLMAAKVMREANLMLTTLLKEARADLSQFQIGRDSPTPASGYDNMYVRHKRNILGDILHTLTGVATDDELHKQMKIDEEIREKIAATLNRQITYEKTLAYTYANLSKEEEKLHERVDEMARKHALEKSKTRKMTALHDIAMDDIRELEDILATVKTGEANTRHAIKLSQKTGLSTVASFQFHNISGVATGPVVWYKSWLTSTVPVRVQVEQTHLTVDTPSTTYLLHSSFDLAGSVITEYETRALRQPDLGMTGGAILVHVGHRVYKTVTPGTVTCTADGQTRNLTTGQTIQLNREDTCQTTRVVIGEHRLQVKTIFIKMDHDHNSDLAFLHKTLETDKLRVEQRSSSALQHTHNNLQLQHDLNMAQADIDTFLVDTKTNMEVEYIQDTTTWAVLGGVTLIVLTITACILHRICSASKHPSAQ